ADFGEVLVHPGVFVVDEAAEHLVGGAVAQGHGVDLVIVAGVRLPDVLVGAELGADVEHGLQLLGDDIVAQHARGSLGDVDLVGLGAAEVPALGAGPAAAEGGVEQGTAVGDLTGELVVAEQGGAGAAAGAV